MNFIKDNFHVVKDDWEKTGNAGRAQAFITKEFVKKGSTTNL